MPHLRRKLEPKLVNLIKIIQDGEIHHAPSLGEKLNLTRSDVSKAIQKLIDYGAPIKTQKTKGYVLTQPFYLLDQNIIESALNKKFQITKTEIFEKIDSTNVYLRNYWGEHNTRLCLAEQQTQGIGRFNRPWCSPFGKNIYFSLKKTLQKDLSELSGLSLLASLATIKGIKKLIPSIPLMLKWPNDVYHENKKISGALIEVQGENNGLSEVIIGIGVNVNMAETGQENISQPWSSLKILTNQLINRNILASLIMNELLSKLALFEKQGFHPFVADYQKYDKLYNKDLLLNLSNKKIQGKAKSINTLGHLLLELPNGKVKSFASGEASLAKALS